MDTESEPELPLEPTPAINWAAVRKRAYVLITAPKIPAWAVIILLIVREIPDWKSRFDFWLAAARSLGGFPWALNALANPMCDNQGKSAARKRAITTNL
jgi:hypothetical protein